MNQPDLGKKIAELRKAKGLTQEELVEKCNLNVRTLQRIESGEVTPRSYTIKAIFTALDYNIYDSNEIAFSRFRKTGFIISSRLEQLYRYSLDLFNLKTNTMKKITILSVMGCAIVFGLFLLCNESKAQKENKADSKVPDKTSSNTIIDSNLEVHGTIFGWDDNEEIVARDAHCRIDCVKFDVKLITLNKRNREFHSFVTGKLLHNKIEVTITKEDMDMCVTYSADKVEKYENKISLKGKAKLTCVCGSGANSTIEANEILITLN
jgi:transcriptional regulator with XRE-family HTH domain